MSQQRGLNRRAFLRSTGLAALAGTSIGAGQIGTGGPALAPRATPASSRYDFDAIVSRLGTDCTKFDGQNRIFGKDSVEVGMGIADMDFRAAPAITKALHGRMQHDVWGYMDMNGPAAAAYRQGIIDWNKRRYNVTINPANLILTNGVHPALVATLQTFCPRGSKVLMTTPVYNGFYSDFPYAGVTAEESPMRLVNGRYEIDFEDFERRATSDTKVFLLCNPQNPTGNCWSESDLLRLGEICLRKGVIVLADEIHCDFVNKGQKYTPFSTLPNKAVVNNSITYKAASKSFGLAAMKQAWMFSDNADLVARVKANYLIELNIPGLIANKAAYAEGEDWLNQLVEYIDGNQTFAADFIAAKIPLIKHVKPQGTYLAWIDVTSVAERIGAKKLADEANRDRPAGAARLTPEQMVERFFVQNAKVQLNQGASYGLGGANHMRMNLATSRRMVERGLTNIAKALEKIS
jgi:cystathionine beta-lyase